MQGTGQGARKGASRRLVLTAGALLERRPATYEVAERRHLAALAAVVRFAAEPTWLGLEWTDGAPAAMYILPGRDALLAALLDAAQVSIPFTSICCLLTVHHHIIQLEKAPRH